MKLIEPNRKSISIFYNTYYKRDSNGFEPMYRAIEKAIQVFPSHRKYFHVLPKAIIINQLYSTNIFAIRQMAKHICHANITRMISIGNCEAVQVIRIQHGIKSNKTRQEIDFYSFATKYCHSHNPLKFPIYDKNVDFVLWAYQKQDRFSDFERKDLKNYVKFLEVLEDFKSHYNVGKLSINVLDKFLWKQGALILKKK